MSSSTLRSLIGVDIFTDAYRVSGRVVVTGTTTVAGELSNPNSNFLELTDAYISRLNQPGEIITSYALASLRKDNINFVVLQNRREGVPMSSQHFRSIFERGRQYHVFVTVPSFEIHGDIMYESRPTPHGVLIQSVGVFQPIFAAKASASLYPEITYSGDVILVHKDRVGLFCLREDKKTPNLD